MHNEGRVVRTTLKEVPMITKSPAELRRARDHPSGAHGRETGRSARVGPVGVPRVHRGGDTDALDWRSDPDLLAILARGVKREREAREGQFPSHGDELTSQLEAGAGPHPPAFTPAGAL